MEGGILLEEAGEARMEGTVAILVREGKMGREGQGVEGLCDNIP